MKFEFRRFNNRKCIGFGITIDYGYFKGVEIHFLFWTFDFSFKGKLFERRIQRKGD